MDIHVRNNIYKAFTVKIDNKINLNVTNYKQ